jgi:hypothetical protein
MKQVRADIQSGKFVKDWMLESRVNQTSFKAMRAKCDAQNGRGGQTFARYPGSPSARWSPFLAHSRLAEIQLLAQDMISSGVTQLDTSKNLGGGYRWPLHCERLGIGPGTNRNQVDQINTPSSPHGSF